jgi:DNA-directed RNA polymerase subunit RPC12/RpoP
MTKQLKFLMQHACFDCRKAFKRYVSYLPEDEPQPEHTCPECGGKMWEMGRTFKAPRQDDVKQWRKVEALVRNGITFHSYGSHGLGRFPRVLNEVAPFIEKVRHRSEGEGTRLLRKISKKGAKQKAKRSL